MPRPKLLIVAAVLAVIAITLRSVLHNTRMDEQYGMARIHLAHETIYVKSRQCKAGCTGGLWLSRSSDRCQAPNPANDYALNVNQFLYARQEDTLILLGDERSVIRPTGGDWINMRFVPSYGHAVDSLPLQAIIFGEHLPTRNVPSRQVDLESCVRALGHNWNWL